MQYKPLLFYSLLALLSISTKISSQARPDNFKVNTLKIGIASDSLLNKSFEELKTDFYKTQQDSSVSKLIAKHYVLKAKKEKDTAQIINAYYLHSEIYGNSRRLSRKYMDSIIALTENLVDHYYPAKAYLRKGGHFYYEEKYNEALESFLIARKYAKKNNNIQQQITIRNNIGILKNSLYKSIEAIDIFKKNLKFIESLTNNKKQYEKTYISALFGLSDGYNRLRQLDSARIYINKGLYRSFNHSEKYQYSQFLLSIGINSHLSGNYSIALDSLKKASKLLKIKPLNINNVICDLYIGKTLLKLNRKHKAIDYFKKIDAFINEENYILETREAFELLIRHYEKQENVKMQLSTLKKLIKFDSLTVIKNSKLNIDIVKKFDTQNLIEERDAIIKNLGEDKKMFKLGVLILITILLISLSFLYYYYQRQKKLKLQFNKIIKEKKILNSKERVNKQSHEIDLPEEIIENLILKIDAFENKNEFLDSTLTLEKLSKRLGTNSSYLSKVINYYKEKNFSTYLNDLRIDYAVERIKIDKKIRKYSIKGIAGECGYKNDRSFSRAFNKKTGLQPSYFIKEIEREMVSPEKTLDNL